MSAYLCENEHFVQLAAWLCNDDRSGLDWLMRRSAMEAPRDGAGYTRNADAEEIATHIANVLKKENARSLSARYDDRAEGYWSDKDDAIPPVTLGEVTRMQICDLGKIAKATDCYEYQACESDDFEQSVAYRVCMIIRKEIGKRCQGYAEANWGIPVEFTEPAPEIYSLSAMMRQ